MTEQTLYKRGTEVSLMEGVAAGDEACLAALYDRHHLVALRVAIRILHDRGRAEDVVQEAFLSVWRKGGSYAPARGTVKSWILGIVRNRAIDMLRAQRESNADDEATLLSLHDSGPSVPDQVATRLDGDTVRAAMNRLPPLQRQAIAGAYFEGRSHSEIAETTGLPLGTVHGRIRLGMRRLRAYLMAAGMEAPGGAAGIVGIGANMSLTPPSPQHGTS